MPDTSKRIDDRTFFILYALAKKGHLDLPNVKTLYDFELDTTRGILDELEKLRRGNEVKIEFYFSENENAEDKITEKIFENKKNYLELIGQLNNCVQNNISMTQNINFQIPSIKYFAYILGCRFSIRDELQASFVEKFENYFNHQEPINRLYPDKEHHAVFKKYFNTHDGKNMLLNPKIKISRITGMVEDYPKVCTRYNFWHFIKKLEKLDIIQVHNLFIDENEPTIDFIINNTQKFLSKTLKESILVKKYGKLTLYNDKIVYKANSVPIERGYQLKLLQYAFENPTGRKNISRKKLAEVCNFNPDNITTATSAVNRIIQKVCNNTDKKLIELPKRNGDLKIISLDELEL